MELVKKKRERRKKENGKTNRLNVRLTDEEYGMLLFLTNATGETYSDVLRKALKFYYITMSKYYD